MPTLLCVLILLLSAPFASAEAIRGSAFKSTKNSIDAPSKHLFFSSAPRGRLDTRNKRSSVLSREIRNQPHDFDVSVIRDMIQEAESRHHGYDAVQHGARIKPRKRPTQMTLGEIFTWIDRTPKQPHAIGRYQFVPQTLRRVVVKIGAKRSQRFTPKLQDQLADVLLAEAGLHKFRTGTIHRHQFMNNLAAIWAGLPNSTGKSHYHGYAGNKASVSWARFDSVMRQISPKKLR